MINPLRFGAAVVKVILIVPILTGISFFACSIGVRVSPRLVQDLSSHFLDH